MSAIFLQASAFLLLLICLFSVSNRGREVSLIDLHILLLAVMLGIYSIVNALTLENFILAGFDESLVFILFLSFSLSVFFLYIAKKTILKKAHKHLALYELSLSLSKVKKKHLVFIVAIVLGFDLHLFIDYGIISYYDFNKITLPTGYGQIRKFLLAVKYGSFFVFFSYILHNKLNLKEFFFLSLLMLMLLSTMLVLGRRVLFFLMVLLFLFSFFRKNKKIFDLRVVSMLIFMLLILLIFSNFYQANRWVFQEGDLSNIQLTYDSFFDFKETIANLAHRGALWQFNYFIFEAQVLFSKAVTGGAILLESFFDSIPRILYPDKVVIDSDILIAAHYGLPEVDSASSFFSVLTAEFGLFFILLYPAFQIFIFIFLYQLFKISKSNTIACFLLTSLSLKFFMEIESGPIDIFVFVYNILAVTFISLLVSYVVKPYKKNTPNSKQLQI